MRPRARDGAERLLAVAMSGLPGRRAELGAALRAELATITDAGVGLLDVDLMAAGDLALDLAIRTEHLLLPGRQGVLADPDSAGQALLSGYWPDEDVSSRVTSYRALSHGDWRLCTPSGRRIS